MGAQLLYGKQLRLHQHCIWLWHKPHGLIAWAFGARAYGVTIAPQGPRRNVNAVCSSSSHATWLSFNLPDYRVYPQIFNCVLFLAFLRVTLASSRSFWSASV